MPIYEYECPKCGVFEVVQKVTDKPVKANPDCTEKNCPCKAKRILSASAFHLKGTGWYKTDYASSSSSSSGSSKSTKSASSSSETSAASTSEGSSTSAGESAKKGKKSSGGGGCGSGCGCH